MKYSTEPADKRKTFNEAERRKRRKIARDLWAMYDAILRAGRFEPIERRASQAVDSLLWECAGQDYDTPRPLSLVNIGGGLTSKSDEKKAREDRARAYLGQLFNHAIPREGYQILTRYKAREDEGKPHDYASHILPVAEFYAELHDEERRVILADKLPKKGVRIAEARERLAVEALEYLPKCDSELVDAAGIVYAYVSEAQAKAFCKSNDGYTVRPLRYSEPGADSKPLKLYYADDFKRLKNRAVKQAVDLILGDIEQHNGKATAREFWKRELLPAIEHAGDRWMNRCRERDDDGEREKELIHVGDLGGVGASEPGQSPSEPLRTSEGSPSVSGIDSSDLEKRDSETSDLAGRPNGTDANVTETDAASVPQPNFISALEAALWYVGHGWAVVPCCQFNPVTGRCTGPESHHSDGICKGKRPLIRGRKGAKPGDGYTAAVRDKGLVTDWFTRQFPDAGVAIRLDGHILIDCDVKNGARGIESYQILADTFNLDATLSAVTPSGGRHHIFKLPDDLPADYLGSWTRVLDVAELDGIDLKVGNKGLCHVEPTRGKTGVYRWIDPTADIATLPRECCDYLHDIHEQATKPNVRPVAHSELGAFDPDEDQSKYFKDAPNGQRRPHLRSIACALAARGATVEQGVNVLHWHDSHFSEPTNDGKFILKVMTGAVAKFGPQVEVAR